MVQFKYLEKGQVMSFDQALKIQVLFGEIWVTKENDGTDYLLTEKDILCSVDNSLMVIEALEGTSLIYSKQADLVFEHTEAAPRSIPIDVASAL